MAEHPGDELKRLMAERGLNQTDLSFILGKHHNAVYLIMSHKSGISAEMSRALGAALSVPENYFADLQTVYDLENANPPAPEIATRAALLQNYPVREMIKRGWLPEDSADNLRSHLAEFFGLSDPNEIPYIAHVAKKTSYELNNIPPSQLVWLFRVKHIASRMVAPPFSAKTLADNAEKLRLLTTDPEGARFIPRVLSACGVRFVVVETLPSAKIDGVCFWLDDSTPVIGMSLRFDRIDNLWFVLRHEIEHVLQKHGTTDPMVDYDMETDPATSIDEKERIANEAASDFCVPREKFRSWMNRHAPIPSERDLLAFAKLHKIHPGLVVGQVQRRLSRYDYLRKYQVKVRHHVLPTATADGFGYSVPL